MTLLAFYVLLTVHLGIVFVNNQLDAQFFPVCLFHSIQIFHDCSNYKVICKRQV